MGRKSASRKRPCRICGKWFSPNPRVGDRQKTCGAEECKRRWHTLQCARYNKKNREQFKESHLGKRLAPFKAETAVPSASPPLPTHAYTPGRGEAVGTGLESPKTIAENSLSKPVPTHGPKPVPTHRRLLKLAILAAPPVVGSKGLQAFFEV